MRCAVLGDIHGNLHALEAVLDHLRREGIKTILCVGDLVGYGANPKECIQAIRDCASCVVAGNHDYGAAASIGIAYFNADARDSIEWTGEQLSEEELVYLGGLPLTAQFEDVLLVHSTPYLPEYFSYIQTLYDATLAFDGLKQKLAFVGHSHVPIVFVNTDPIDYFFLNDFEIQPDKQMIINVGSVGQPRDLDPRAAYAVLDTDRRSASIRRVRYDIEAAAQAIVDVGLPSTNAERLLLGR